MRKGILNRVRFLDRVCLSGHKAIKKEIHLHT